MMAQIKRIRSSSTTVTATDSTIEPKQPSPFEKKRNMPPPYPERQHGCVRDFVPLWKTPSPVQAIEILRTCRAWTDDTIAPLSDTELVAQTPLGDGTWSIKDLLGHLATWEERALTTMGARPKRSDPTFADVNAHNAHHLERKRSWSLTKVRKDYDDVRSALVAAIEAMNDETWLHKIDVGGGRRSALALVLAKMLNGDRYGYFAHDFAHARGLEKAVRSLRGP
jgi:hypothetical protein